MFFQVQKLVVAEAEVVNNSVWPLEVWFCHRAHPSSPSERHGILQSSRERCVLAGKKVRSCNFLYFLKKVLM
jgi:hypothetical protein